LAQVQITKPDAQLMKGKSMQSLTNIKILEALIILKPKNMKQKICTLALAALLSACSCPDVVETKKIGDENMSCQQLLTEIREIENARQTLGAEKGVTGQNVAAVLFFWPALIATHSNVNDAVRALDQRKSYLVEIYNKKSCQNSDVPRPLS